MEEKTTNTETIRLNKYLSDVGVCSRREADRLVEQGRVEVNGRKAQMGERVTDQDEIRIDDRLIKKSTRKILLVVNKPRGIVCSTQQKDNIVEFLGYPERLYPAGRLDKDSEGLVLMTNDGSLMDEILRARNYHEKEYEVRVDQPITKEFLEQMSSGVEILDTKTRPCKVTQINKFRFRIILTQGLNRQIRRMCEALGYRVRELKRIRIMNIELGSLPLGAYREANAEELEGLEKMIHASHHDDEFKVRAKGGASSDIANVNKKAKNYNKSRTENSGRSYGKENFKKTGRDFDKNYSGKSVRESDNRSPEKRTGKSGIIREKKQGIWPNRDHKNSGSARDTRRS